MKFRVICVEKVGTEFSVETPSLQRLGEWLEEKGADVVSTLTERQTVHQRNYEMETWSDSLSTEKAEYNTEKEPVVTCKFCEREYTVTEQYGHWHRGEPVCNACWDERLKVTG